MTDKVFKTYDQLLDILKNRGLTIGDSTKAKRTLQRENYYNLINGYKKLFIETPKSEINGERFKQDATLSEIKALYDFDCELKSIFLKRILRIENTVKSLIAHAFSKEYGHDNYLLINNFNFIEGDLEQARKIISLIQRIQGNIAQHIKRHDSIKHYMSVYGYIPLWVLFKILPLSTISIFYDLMKQKDRQSVSSVYQIPDSTLSIFL